jgi:pyruvate dehydrogenase (quinone)
VAQTVADVLVGVLELIGVKQIFGLIGDSLNPLADAIRRSQIEWIGVRHEEGAALAVAGEAKLSGRLAVCAGTTGPAVTIWSPGSMRRAATTCPSWHCLATRRASCTASTTSREPDLLFRNVSLYTETVASATQAAGAIHQAIAAAYAGRGVAHPTLPQDVIAAKAENGFSSVATLKPRPELAANDADITELVRRIDQAGSVVIMCGAGCHSAARELRALSDRLKAPLINSLRAKDIMPYDDLRWMGGTWRSEDRRVFSQAAG